MIGPVREGLPEPLGLTLDDGGANVAIFSAHAEAIELCLFDADGAAEIARIRLPGRTGKVFHARIEGIREGDRYGLRAHGRFEPSAGHRFDPTKLLIDPHAVALDRPFVLHASMFDSFARPGEPVDSAAAMPKAIALASGPAVAEGGVRVPWAETIVYELPVGGFTRRHPDVPDAARGTFSGLAHPAAIAHLTRLGVSTVEIMPAAAWIDERHLPPLNLSNYWGYNPVAFLAPDPRLAPGGWAEVRHCVAALHAAGLEVIVDVVLNHTGESDEFGPTVSLRGLDNATYYRLLPNEAARYINDTGCGHTLALDRPPVVRLAMDALRAWALRGGVDGFRFDLATTLARRDGGFDPAAPLLAAIEQDPALRGLKLIAEPWDIGPGGYQLGAFPPLWGEWNDRFRDDVRRFWRGDRGMAGALATRFSGSADLFAGRRPSRSVNYVVAHDGFTLADLVSFERKHNEANGEDNRDGSDDNLSWNNGIEGATTDRAVRAARLRDQRAMLATLLLSRGTPMLPAGAESGHSQGGNNNAYAQGNETAWLDWSSLDASLIDTAARLIALRRSHPALRGDRFLSGTTAEGAAYPDIVWLSPAGQAMTEADWHAPDRQTLVAALADPDGGDRLLVILHAGREPLDVLLPGTRAGYHWRLLIDIADPAAATVHDGEDEITVEPRTVSLLHEAVDPYRRVTESGFASRAQLDALARAAGINAAWTDTRGRRHFVGQGTKRALLSGMGLPADTAAQARESQERLSEERDRRPLPSALVGRAGAPIEVALPRAPGGGALALRLEREDGSIEPVVIADPDARLENFVAADGREGTRVRVTLPPQVIGRHRLVREDRADIACNLIVAPSCCHLPDDLARGGRRFGIAAHLYTLRRDGDQGIGDFTTLAGFAEASGRTGAVTLGLNPLHALFGSDRGRASPYYPSDRRFLDPIYIDVAALGNVVPEAVLAPLLNANDAAIAQLSAAAFVDYPAVWTLKKSILDVCFGAFDALCAASPEQAAAVDFARFVQAGGTALRRFATFETISEQRGSEPWFDWPSGLRAAGGPGVVGFGEAHAPRVRFHMFLQWLADRQLSAANARGRAAGLSLGFYRDLAVGAAPDGAECWGNAELLAQGVSVGAPPDPFSPDGQNWGLRPANPLLAGATGYAGFAELLASNMRHAGALRIDHAMGLARLFWIPHGLTARDGAYVSLPLDDMLGVLALESVRAGCLVVGEDLGTVPDGFRERLADADVLSYRVLWFERVHGRFLAPREYPARSVACVSTHDLPTLSGWWDGADIAERRRLDMVAEADAGANYAQRATDREALGAALDGEGLRPEVLAPGLGLASAVHAYLAHTPSMLAIAQADDLARETVGVNLPGTDLERPNWRRKIGVNAEKLLATEDAQRMLGPLREERSD